MEDDWRSTFRGGKTYERMAQKKNKDQSKTFLGGANNEDKLCFQRGAISESIYWFTSSFLAVFYGLWIGVNLPPSEQSWPYYWLLHLTHAHICTFCAICTHSFQITSIHQKLSQGSSRQKPLLKSSSFFPASLVHVLFYSFLRPFSPFVYSSLPSEHPRRSLENQVIMCLFLFDSETEEKEESVCEESESSCVSEERFVGWCDASMFASTTSIHSTASSTRKVTHTYATHHTQHNNRHKTKATTHTKNHSLGLW